MGGSYMGEFAELGVLEPVDTKTFNEKDFFQSGWKQGEVDGQAYGVPWYVDTRVLYYRTDLAEKAYVTKAPTNWKEMQDLATAYQKKAGTKWGLSIQPSGLDTVQNFYSFLYSVSGEIVNDKGEAVIDSPEAVKALKEYGSYFDKGLSNKSVQPGYDVVKDFGNGRVPMFFGGPWHVTLLNEGQPQVKGKWAVANVPADKTSASMVSGSSLVISKDSEHKAAATEFIKYLTDTKGQADWYKRTKDLLGQHLRVDLRRPRRRRRPPGVQEADGHRQGLPVAVQLDGDHRQGRPGHRQGHPGQGVRRGRAQDGPVPNRRPSEVIEGRMK